MSLLNAFNPNHLSPAVRLKSPLAVQREIILQHLLNAITGFAVLGLIFYLARTRIDASNLVLIIPFVATIALQVAITVSRKLPYTVRAVALVLLIALEFLSALSSQGINGSALAYAIAFAAVMAVLFGSRAGVASIVTTFLIMAGLTWLTSSGQIGLPRNLSLELPGLTSAWINDILAFLLTGTSMIGAFFQLTKGLTGALDEQQSLTEQLLKERSQLESHVQARTAELSQKTELLENARQVSSILAAESDTASLLSKAGAALHQQFSLIGVAIYMINPLSNNAELKAATGEAGQQLVEKGYQINLDQPGIIREAVENDHAVYLSSDTQPLNHSRLPATSLAQARTEIALAIKAGGKAVGILDLQSERANRFTPDEIDIFSTIADQLSLALDKTRLYGDLEQSVKNLELSLRQTTQRVWNAHLKGTKRRYAFQYPKAGSDQTRTQPESSRKALATQATVITPAPTSLSNPLLAVNLAVPIKLRGQTIGVINLRVAGTRVSPELIELVEGAVSRLAVALENARLLEDLQTRANRERIVGEVASKVRSATDIESILKTTAGELGRSLGVSEVVIQLNKTK